MKLSGLTFLICSSNFFGYVIHVATFLPYLQLPHLLYPRRWRCIFHIYAAIYFHQMGIPQTCFLLSYFDINDKKKELTCNVLCNNFSSMRIHSLTYGMAFCQICHFCDVENVFQFLNKQAGTLSTWLSLGI